MEVLNQIEFIIGLGVLVSGMVISIGKFFYDIKRLGERVTELEGQMSENQKGDNQVADRIKEVETTLTTVVKALRAIMKQLKIPDLL